MSDPWQDLTLEPVYPRPGQQVGWVYFIACKETQRCKIGFTKGDVEKRLKNLQTGAAGELRLIAMQPGTPDTERALHERFAEQRLHGEWFETNEAMFAYMCAVVWTMAGIYSKQGVKPPLWMVAGLHMLREMWGELPDHLEAML